MGYGMDEDWLYDDDSTGVGNEATFDARQRLYHENGNAATGSVIKCACCFMSVKKKSYQQKFCSIECKDRYWNALPCRSKRAAHFSSRRGLHK